jgi:hypothetical protein
MLLLIFLNDTSIHMKSITVTNIPNKSILVPSIPVTSIPILDNTAANNFAPTLPKPTHYPVFTKF